MLQLFAWTRSSSRDASSSSLLSPTWRDERSPPQVLPALCSRLRTHLLLPRIPFSLLGAILHGPPFPYSKRHADRFGVQHVPLGRAFGRFAGFSERFSCVGAYCRNPQGGAVETVVANKTMIVPRTPLHTVIFLSFGT